MIRFVLTSLLAAFVCAVSPAADYSWTNPNGGQWNTPTNWSGGVVPTVSDNVTLGTLASAYTVTMSSTNSINNITVIYSGATVNQTGSLTVNSAFNLNAGIYNLSSGTLSINGSLTVGTSAVMNWTGGIINSGPIGGIVSGNINVIGSLASGVTFSGTTFNNTGTLRWTSGAMSVVSGVAIINSGIVQFLADGSAFSGTGIIYNTGGTLRKSGGITTSTDIAPTVNFTDGNTVSTIDAQNGTVNFNGNVSLNGTLNISGSGTVNFNNSTNLSGNLNVSNANTLVHFQYRYWI